MDATTWFVDADGDGYGDPATATAACTQPAGTTDEGTDCDDTDGDVNPDGSESCNGVDDDCDGTPDEDATDAVVWYEDTDGDGYGDPARSTLACSPPQGSSDNDDDCDDSAADVNPDGTDLPGDGIDQDCDGSDATAALGFYVSAALGTNGATGTMADPFLTIQEAATAAAAAGHVPVFIAGGSYSEFVTTEVPLLGGHDDQSPGWPRTLDRSAVSVARITMDGDSPEAQTLTTTLGFICNDGSTCVLDDVAGSGSAPFELPYGFPCGTGSATITDSIFTGSGADYAVEMGCGTLTLTDSVVEGGGGIHLNAGTAVIERNTINATSGIALDLARGGTVRDNTVTTGPNANYAALLQTGIATDAGTPLVVEGNSFSGADTGVELRGRMDVQFSDNEVLAERVGVRAPMVSVTPEPVLHIDDNDVSVGGTTLPASEALYVSQAAVGTVLRNSLHVGPTSAVTSVRGATFVGSDLVVAHNEIWVQSSPARDYGILVTNQFQADRAPTLVNNSVWVEGGGVSSHALRDERATTTTTPLVVVGNVFSVDGGSDPSAIYKTVRGPLDLTSNLIDAATTTCIVQDTLNCFDDLAAEGCTMSWGVCTDLLVADPLFVDPSVGDLSLQATSLAVDSGIDPSTLG